jgi:hypothetical protein
MAREDEKRSFIRRTLLGHSSSLSRSLSRARARSKTNQTPFDPALDEVRVRLAPASVVSPRAPSTGSCRRKRVSTRSTRCIWQRRGEKRGEAARAFKLRRDVRAACKSAEREGARRAVGRGQVRSARKLESEVRANSNATSYHREQEMLAPLRLITSPSSAPGKCFSHGHAVAAAPAIVIVKRCTTEAMPLSTPGHAAAATGGDGYAPRSATTPVRKEDGLGRGSTVSGLKPRLGSLWPTRGDKGMVVRLGKCFSTESEDDSSTFSLLISVKQTLLQQASEPRVEGSLRQGVRDKLARSVGAAIRAVKKACFLAGPIRQ